LNKFASLPGIEPTIAASGKALLRKGKEPHNKRYVLEWKYDAVILQENCRSKMCPLVSGQGSNTWLCVRYLRAAQVRYTTENLERNRLALTWLKKCRRNSGGKAQPARMCIAKSGIGASPVHTFRLCTLCLIVGSYFQGRKTRGDVTNLEGRLSATARAHLNTERIDVTPSNHYTNRPCQSETKRPNRAAYQIRCVSYTTLSYKSSALRQILVSFRPDFE